MADVINLNRFRKAKARASAEKRAAENRVNFGRTKAEKRAAKAEAERASRTLEAGRIAPSEEPTSSPQQGGDIG